MWRSIKVQPWPFSKWRIPFKSVPMVIIVMVTMCDCTLSILCLKKVKWDFKVPRKFPGRARPFLDETRAQNRRKPSESDNNAHRTSHLPGESRLAGTSGVCGLARSFIMSSWFMEGWRTATFSEVLFHVGNGQSGCVNHQSDGPSESWACNGLPVGRRPRVSRVHRNETAPLPRQSFVMVLVCRGQHPVVIARASFTSECTFVVAASAVRVVERHFANFPKQIQLTSFSSSRDHRVGKKKQKWKNNTISSVQTVTYVIEKGLLFPMHVCLYGCEK